MLHLRIVLVPHALRRTGTDATLWMILRLAAKPFLDQSSPVIKLRNSVFVVLIFLAVFAVEICDNRIQHLQPDAADQFPNCSPIVFNGLSEAVSYNVRTTANSPSRRAIRSTSPCLSGR